MRYTVSSGRSAAAGGLRLLVFVALLALLHTALTTDSSQVPIPEGDGCRLTRASAPAVYGPAGKACVAAGPVLTSTGGGTKHPGSGVRRKCEASACHLRHQVPTGSSGKALGDPPVEETITASADVPSGAVVTTAAAKSPKRTVVLRC
ncbi:hypothetical protein [Streptomyces inhibens]|uniref:hypothetical protein n=1 Tax=Streptomyces inhibens TaxID=2293571 RepID=UPI001EE75703|nr:hypothetical protein [Streptomyces inhibens]UKY48307.1 hypothetical protein KI385_05500 [Streptomyces inhibens]